MGALFTPSLPNRIHYAAERPSTKASGCLFRACDEQGHHALRARIYRDAGYTYVCVTYRVALKLPEQKLVQVLSTGTRAAFFCAARRVGALRSLGTGRTGAGSVSFLGARLAGSVSSVGCEVVCPLDDEGGHPTAESHSARTFVASGPAAGALDRGQASRSTAHQR